MKTTLDLHMFLMLLTQLLVIFLLQSEKSFQAKRKPLPVQEKKKPESESEEDEDEDEEDVDADDLDDVSL